MDNSEDLVKALEELDSILREISNRPYDISLHIKHIRLAQSLQDEKQVGSACEMMTTFLAAGDEAWIPRIDLAHAATDMTSEDSIGELLALYELAENDYLSIPILDKHLHFILDQHALYHGEEAEERPISLGNMFSTLWTREAIAGIAQKAKGHISLSSRLWDKQRDWLLETLETVPTAEKSEWAAYIDSLFTARLNQPHINNEETFQSYSSFVTNTRPATEYESILVSASKSRSRAVKSYDRWDSFESQLRQSQYSLDAYARYIAQERRTNPEIYVVSGIYERAIAEAAKRRFDQGGQLGGEGEQALRTFWIGYLDRMRTRSDGSTSDASQFSMDSLVQRAVRSVPSSGEVWARYIRHLERSQTGADVVTEAYNKALSSDLIQKDIEQLIPLILARAGFELRQIKNNVAPNDAFERLIQVVEGGIELVRQTSEIGDARLRLEKFLADAYLHIVDLPEKAIDLWRSTAKHYKSSYLAWTSLAETLTKQGQYDEARIVFQDPSIKFLDWPEYIWEAWIAFEHLYGDVKEIEIANDKIEKARYAVNARRAKESYQAMQAEAEQQAGASATVAQLQAQDAQMDVDPTPNEGQSSAHAELKRKADDGPADTSKKARIERAGPPKRDRENSTVFVANLPSQVSDDEVRALFQDCGKIREIKIVDLNGSFVATVEFNERDSVPAALTKDKKRIEGQEIAVHLAWKSTLYVTNFPEKTDDEGIRSLFGQFGKLFDVRWPSKKFKNTRRFCYVQFASLSSAEAALELNGRELEPGITLNVYISNPEKKKERTDADANEREIYVAGLSKFTTKADLEKLFKTYGPVKEVRMATELDGKAKGFAFVEFTEERDARAALAANNFELKNRRIAVTLSDPRVRSKNKNFNADSGLGKSAELRSRSVTIQNLPSGAQEGLLQQALEKLARVSRVEVFQDKNEATVELENAAEAGLLLLRTDPIEFGGNVLQISQEGAGAGGKGKESRPVAPASKAGGNLFVPRSTVSRPRAGLGHSRKPGLGAASKAPESSKAKGQDDFRKMLG